MSLEHSPARSARTDASPSREDDDEVLTVHEWAALNKISYRTARRILTGPKKERPVITQLSENCRGITRGNNRAWQQSRAR
jgi:hypothetical protein